MKSKWPSDAGSIDVKDIENFLFKNDKINEYKESEGKLFIVANKGMGKTLLLSYKRFYMYNKQTKKEGDASSVKFIPENHPFLDSMSDIRDVSKDKIAFLSNFTNSKDLWEFAIKLSIISHSTIPKENLKNLEKVLPSDSIIKDWTIHKSHVSPTLYFSEIIHSLTLRKINQIITKSKGVISQLIRSIHHGYYIFVDKVDQAIKEFPKDAWIHTQAGLLAASYEIYQQNSHLKVYLSIRLEAYFNMDSGLLENFDSYAAILDYNKDELMGIMNSLSRHYEKKDYLEFLTHKNIHNQKAEEEENTFDYLYRHTLGRPRDLVILSSRISKKENITIEDIKDLVHQICEDFVIPNIITESHPFLEYLEEQENKIKFFELIPYNVLTRTQVFEIISVVNNIPKDSLENMPKGSYFNPFLELYNIGLLGVVDRKKGSNKFIQRFKQPFDKIDYYKTELPNSKFFFLHPGLCSSVRKASPLNDFKIFNYFIVGNKYYWNKYNQSIVELQLVLIELTRLGLYSKIVKSIELFLSENIHLIKLGNYDDLLSNWEEIEKILESNPNFLEAHYYLEQIIKRD